MKEIVLTSTTYIPATNSTRVAYAEETTAGIRDGYQLHTIYHPEWSSEFERNEEVDAFIAAENAKLHNV